ncbi:MAG: serine/threonine protein kinase [Planctomycetales bacterium]|nr:serine/threonine protein kinase [Planctomycetales bacterium]
MTQIATTVEPGYEPLPGYVLRNRLGAGGYGEVWSADAPGGLQKAVKIIFGTADDAKASRELKSLERISKVHHPFLLSLERIEVVNNQVVIVTELAESTLYDRFDMYREKGLRGIPRAALLEFLRDAADTLDFLAQKHSLQHLDIKPGNLLIIADRIKVADFGLVKDLYDRDMSMVSGLTPAYSAPEIFDGTPDYRSDQYSLAIVFMEMLTGEMPFQGATLSELARQHIGHAPNLDALPPADRPIIARALSKNPIDRYTTCRQMVDQLLKVKHAGLPSTPA